MASSKITKSSTKQTQRSKNAQQKRLQSVLNLQTQDEKCRVRSTDYNDAGAFELERIRLAADQAARDYLKAARCREALGQVDTFSSQTPNDEQIKEMKGMYLCERL